MKTIIQRALPLTDVYKIHSFHYVSILEGGGGCCENCGKLIANIVTLENQHGVKFIVGSDCAETLTIDKSKMFFEVAPAFKEGKALRTKILNALKKTTQRDKIVRVYISNDYLMMKRGDGSNIWQKMNYPDISINYIKDLLTAEPEQLT